MQNFCSECGKPVQPGVNFCTNCGTKLVYKKLAGNIKFQEKTERALGKNRSNNKHKIFLFTFIGVAIVYILYTFYSTVPPTINPIIKKQPVVTSAISYPNVAKQMTDIEAQVAGDKIILPLDIVKEKKLVAFNFRSGEKEIPLLAYISSEGKLITAVSMCEPCQSTRFHIRENKIVCNSCGTTWELNNLDAISGSCLQYPPDAVPSIIKGNEIQIEKNIVANWVSRI